VAAVQAADTAGQGPVLVERKDARDVLVRQRTQVGRVVLVDDELDEVLESGIGGRLLQPDILFGAVRRLAVAKKSHELLNRMCLGSPGNVDALTRLALYVVVDVRKDSTWHSKPAVNVLLGEDGRLPVHTPIVLQSFAQPEVEVALFVGRAPTNRPAVSSLPALTTADPPRQLQQPKMVAHSHRRAREGVVLVHSTSHVVAVHLVVDVHGMYQQRNQDCSGTHRPTMPREAQKRSGTALNGSDRVQRRNHTRWRAPSHTTLFSAHASATYCHKRMNGNHTKRFQTI